MKFLGNPWIIIKLKVKKKQRKNKKQKKQQQSFALSMKNNFLEKPQGGGVWNWPPALLELRDGKEWKYKRQKSIFLTIPVESRSVC